jgi:hypothetical protein
MRETHVSTYKPGDYWVECPVCGFDYYRSQLRERYDGVWVCPPCWDPQPRDWKKPPVKPERPFIKDI